MAAVGAAPAVAAAVHVTIASSRFVPLAGCRVLAKTFRLTLVAFFLDVTVIKVDVLLPQRGWNRWPVWGRWEFAVDDYPLDFTRRDPQA